jgi:hypothetical protein
MRETTARIVWGIVFAALAALGIPWFLWGSDLVVAGLPVWLWWHVGWMLLTAVAFWLFTRTEWGLWVEDAAVRAGPTDASARDAGGERP